VLCKQLESSAREPCLTGARALLEVLENEY
jgi:hypothetical protein